VVDCDSSNENETIHSNCNSLIQIRVSLCDDLPILHHYCQSKLP
jgi:hypothetical protein